MPTYSYQCQKCGTVTDVFHSMSATPKVCCSSCSSRRMKRLMGTGAGIIFKGSGFYQTDYKNGSKGESKGDSKESKGSESKAESKPEGKSETKTEAKPASSAKPSGGGEAA